MDDFDSLTDAVFFVPPSSNAKGKAKGRGGDNSDSHFRLDGFQQLKDVNESLAATELRLQLFNKEWANISSRIEKVMLDMNIIALDAIYSFVQSAYSLKEARNLMPIQELPAGIVFAGINVPDHDVLFQQIAQTLSNPTPPSSSSSSSTFSDQSSTETKGEKPEHRNYVAILQSKDCSSLKTALKSMIEQFLSIEIRGATNPLEEGMKLQNYDMIVLERWYRSICHDTEGSRKTKPTLVVIIQDFESFDHDTLEDLVTICSNYQDRIQFVFLMGLATSMDALHQGLSKSALSLLQTRKFQMQQSNECLTAIVEDLFINSNVDLMVGPLPLKQLIDQFMHYNFSVGGFVSNLKYIVMHHFYANPLSILCDRSLTSDSPALDMLELGHFDHLRMLPSFQRYVESKVESDPQMAEMLLLDNEFLAQHIPELVKDIRDYHGHFSAVFGFLWWLQSRFSISILKKSKRVLYFMALDGALPESSHITFLLTLVRKLNSNDMMLFVEEWLHFFKCLQIGTGDLDMDSSNVLAQELLTIQSIRDRMVALLDVVSEDSATSSSEIEDNDKDYEKEDGNQDRNHQLKTALESKSFDGVEPAGGSKRPFTFVKKRKLVSLNANDAEGRQTRIAKKTRETARMPKGALGAYTMLVKEIDETLSRILRSYLACYTRLPFHEIFYYSQVTIQQKAFLPQPRASIQTALGQPEQYLNCACCHPPQGTKGVILADVVLPTQHDTCILYKLYVECGRMINMYDWFSAFGMILERGLDSNTISTDTKKKTMSKKKGRQQQQPPDFGRQGGLDQKEVQARFISGVAELQFMGFIKPTNRKTDHVQRLTWGNI
ncbi:Origin recognition complex subunit 3 [Podila humilis]|nr:Origin recognition complex subunit 3 [Podila humilis]